MFTAIQHLLAAFEDGIHRVVPHCEVLRRFAADDTGRDTGRWLQSLDPCAEGVIGVLTAAADQRLLAGSPAPVVVWGSVFPEAGRLPWVDADWRSNGEALAAHLVRLRRFPAALLMHTVWAYGDNLMLEGMLDQLARQAEVAPADLRVRSVGQTDEAVFEAVRTLLAQADAPRTCVLRSSFMLPPALAALREMGREPSSVLAVADYTAPSGAGHDLLHFRPAQTPAEQGAVAAAMLRAQLQGRAEGRRPHVVATALHGAGETAPW
jgi:DNA-binding LacI/PurR family transcriptional regulator